MKDLKSMPFLTACWQGSLIDHLALTRVNSKKCLAEALRLYTPSVGYPRQAIRDTVVGGFSIPAGAFCILDQYSMHRNPDFWPCPGQYFQGCKLLASNSS